MYLQSRSNSNSRLNVDEVQKRIREAENVNLRTRNNLKLGNDNDNDNDHGRGDRGRNYTPPKATPTSTSTLAAPNPVRSRVAELKRQFELKKAGNLADDVVDLDVKPTGNTSTSLPVHVATNIKDVVDLDVRPKGTTIQSKISRRIESNICSRPVTNRSKRQSSQNAVGREKDHAFESQQDAEVRIWGFVRGL